MEMCIRDRVLGGCASTRHNSQTTEMQADGIVDEEETEIFFESETEDSSVAEDVYKRQVYHRGQNTF